MAVTAQDVSNWFAANPNATPQQVANAIASVGGLTPTISSAVAQQYGTTPSVVAQQYGALTQPSAPVQAPVQQSLQATNPALYNAVMSNLQGIADENWGGKIQPYQTQIVSPIDPSKINAPKQLEREPAVYRTIQTEEGPAQALVSGGNFKGVMSLGGDAEGNSLGYVSTTPTYINQIPIVATYDQNGKLTGYTQQKGIGGELLVTKTGGKGYVSGNWDVSGNPNPRQGAWGSGGGFLGNNVGTLAGLAGLAFGVPALAETLGAGAGGGLLGGGAEIGLANDLGMAADYASAANAGAFGAPAGAALSTVPNIGTVPTPYPPTQVADISGGLPSTYTGQGLTQPTAANLASMGSAQGLQSGITTANLAEMGGGQGLTTIAAGTPSTLLGAGGTALSTLGGALGTAGLAAGAGSLLGTAVGTAAGAGLGAGLGASTLGGLATSALNWAKENPLTAAGLGLAATKALTPSTPTSTTTTTSIDPEMRAAYLRNLEEARATAAGLAPRQFAPFPEYNLGMVQKYMNPYETQVVQGALGDIERARQMQIAQEGAQATAAKAFGGSRQAVARSLVDEAALRNAGNLAAQLRQQGFAQAQNLGLSQEALRQQYEQQRLDAARNLGLERLNVAQGALSLQPANLGGTQTTPLYRNPLTSGLGGALGGATLGKLIGGTVNPEYAGYGAGLGGLLGFLG